MELLPEERESSLRRAFPNDAFLFAAALALLAADATPVTVIDHPAVSELFRLDTRTFASTAIHHSPSNAGY
jgi:hypothetical protein